MLWRTVENRSTEALMIIRDSRPLDKTTLRRILCLLSLLFDHNISAKCIDSLQTILQVKQSHVPLGYSEHNRESISNNFILIN